MVKKRRGPGRPKGSKNKPKSTGLVIPRRNFAEIVNRLDKSMMHQERLVALIDRLRNLMQTDRQELDERARFTTGRIDSLEVEIRTIGGDVRMMKADAEHPTTQVLARRLLVIENSERVSLDARDRISRLESDMATLMHHHDRLLKFETDMVEMRRDMKEILVDYFERTNRIEVTRIANQPDEE